MRRRRNPAKNPSYIMVGCLSNVLGRCVSSASLLSGEALTDQRVRPYKVFTVNVPRMAQPSFLQSEICIFLSGGPNC